MKNELQTMRLFSPLFPHIYPFNEWGDLEDDMVEMDADELLQYTDEIEALIQKAQHPSEDKHGLAIYIHDESLSRKVSSIYPGVEEHGGALWCVTEVKTYGALTPAEYAELTDYLTGQYSDGWGEGLEQREIKTSEGELYVSFWSSSDRFFIKPENEMEFQPPSFGMTMGGR